MDAVELGTKIYKLNFSLVILIEMVGPIAYYSR